jgi:hypothetical protein
MSHPSSKFKNKPKEKISMKHEAQLAKQSSFFDPEDGGDMFL